MPKANTINSQAELKLSIPQANTIYSQAQLKLYMPKTNTIYIQATPSLNYLYLRQTQFTVKLS